MCPALALPLSTGHGAGKPRECAHYKPAPPFVMQVSALKPWTSQPKEPKLLPQVHPPEDNPCHSGQKTAVDRGGTCRVGFYSTGAQVALSQGGIAPVMERSGEGKLWAEI